MQSQSPCILKHFFPISFSQEVIDQPSTPPRRSFIPAQDNPLQNIKLRALEKLKTPQFVLTFANQSSRKFKPKQSLNYNNLLHFLKEEHLQFNAMLAQTKTSAICSSSRSLKNENKHQTQKLSPRKDSTPSQIIADKRKAKSVKKSVPFAYKEDSPKMRIKQDAVETELSQSPRHYGQTFRMIHTSHSGRLWKINPEKHCRSNTAIEDRRLTIRIKGSKAPNPEVVDHLRRNSMKQFCRC